MCAYTEIYLFFGEGEMNYPCGTTDFQNFLMERWILASKYDARECNYFVMAMLALPLQ